MQITRVGLIGFGYAGQTFHAPLIGATEGLQLVAVASSRPDKVHAELGPTVDVLSPAALIARPDIDLVVIATPNELHHGLALSALAAGRHVVVDKPFALDAAEAREMAAAAKQAGRVLSVFHNRRWDAGVLTMGRVLREGRLGRPVEFVAHFDRFRPEVRDRWRERAAPGSGLWMDLGPHLVDDAMQAFGQPSAITLDTAMLRDGAVSDDWFSATLRWDGGPHAGLRARLHGSLLAARPGPHLTVHGTEATLIIETLDPQEDALKRKPSVSALRSAEWGRDDRTGALWFVEGSAPRAEPVALENGSYGQYYSRLRDALLGRGDNPVPVAQAIAVQEALDAGRKSVLERREVALA